MLGEERVSEVETELSALLEERVSDNDLGPFGNEAAKAHMSSLVNDVLLSLLESYTPTAVRVLLTKVKDLNSRVEFEEFLDSTKVQGAEDLRPHLFRLWMRLHNGNTKRSEVEKLKSYDNRVTRQLFNQKLREIIDYVIINYCTSRGFIELNEEPDTSWRASIASSEIQQELEDRLTARELYTADLFNQVELANRDDLLLFDFGMLSVLQTLSIEDVHQNILIHYSKEIPGPRQRRTTLFQLIEATMPLAVQTLFKEIEHKQFQQYIANPNAPETQYIRNSFFDLYGSFIGWRLCRRQYDLADIASEEIDPKDVIINGDTLGFVLDKLYSTHPPAFHTLYAYIKGKGWKADLVDNIATAIVNNRFQLAKQLIEISTHLDRPLFDGNCLVHLAAMRGFVGVIAKLHKYAANVGIKRVSDGRTAYHLVVENTQGVALLDDLRAVQTIEMLKRCNADINSLDSSGATPLHSSIRQVGRINSALKIIALGANVDVGSFSPLTLLLDSKTYFSMRLYTALVQAHASLYVYPQSNGTHVNAVMIAILSRFAVIQKLEALAPTLLSTPADVNRQVDSAGSTYLHWLLDFTTPDNIQSDLASLKFLVARGLDLNRPNLLGYSALDQVVIDSKYPRLFVFLVERGVKFSDMAKNSLIAQIRSTKRFYVDALDARLQEPLTQTERVNIAEFKMTVAPRSAASRPKRTSSETNIGGRENDEIKRSRESKSR